jgi:hypothetical protein
MNQSRSPNLPFREGAEQRCLTQRARCEGVLWCTRGDGEEPLWVRLATYAGQPRRLTDACFIAAAEASADQVGPSLRARGMLFPSQSDILETEVTTATRVAEFMFDQGLAQVDRPRDIRAWIEGQLYKPQY